MDALRYVVAYGSALLAQDELQAAEHPVLGAIREALLAEGQPARTEDTTGATPVLVDVEPDTGLITNCDLTAGNTPDADTAERLLQPVVC